jgi:hypothetical protein
MKGSGFERGCDMSGPEAGECPTAGKSDEGGGGDANRNGFRAGSQANDPNEASKHVLLS